MSGGVAQAGQPKSTDWLIVEVHAKVKKIRAVSSSASPAFGSGVLCSLSGVSRRTDLSILLQMLCQNFLLKNYGIFGFYEIDKVVRAIIVTATITELDFNFFVQPALFLGDFV